MESLKSKYEDNYIEPLVLVVDDNLICRKMVGRMLNNWGIGCIEAENALQAFELISAKSCTMVLMDLHMPEIDGFEATEFIRNLNDSYFKDIPIIGFSAHREEELRTAIRESGISDYISKPFTPANLRDKLTKYNILEAVNYSAQNMQV